MSDDYGRGQLGWPQDRWQALDKTAADCVAGHAILRHLFDFREEPGAFTARIGKASVQVETLGSEFDFDMQAESDEDLERRVRIAAQDLAKKEDEAAVKILNFTNLQKSADLKHAEFLKAKNALRAKGVQHGFGVIGSDDALTQLETESVGVQSGLEVSERRIGAKVAQTVALPYTEPTSKNKIDAVVFQAVPAAYRMVRAWGPRLRVLSITTGQQVKLRLEEGIAVGELEPGRCLGIFI